jgi:DNA-binding beta-propeller fold protein YncE
VTNVISTDLAPLTVALNSKATRVFVTVEFSARISVIDNPEDGPSSREPPAGIHPIVTHVDGSPFQDMERPGQQLIISYDFYNDGGIEQSDSEVVAIFEIRNEEDMTIFLSLQAIDLASFVSKNVEVTWTGEKPGGYWIHTMLLTDLDQPQPIGNKQVWGIEMADETEIISQ